MTEPFKANEENPGQTALANHHKKACGCRSGRYLMSATAVALLVWHFVPDNQLSNSTLIHVASLTGITLASALFGKLLGWLWARCQLLRLAGNMHNVVARVVQRKLQ